MNIYNSASFPKRFIVLMVKEKNSGQLASIAMLKVSGFGILVVRDDVMINLACWENSSYFIQELVFASMLRYYILFWDVC